MRDSKAISKTILGYGRLLLAASLQIGLWMVPALFLFAALDSTSARAATIACGTATCITSGGYVAEIQGLKCLRRR
jgi:hypothetical protein